MTDYLEWLLSFLYPRRCPVCDEIVVPKGKLICDRCVSKLSFVHPPVCKKCGKEVETDLEEYCFDCMKNKRTFEYGYALLNYDAVAKASVTKIKYHNKREYLDFYGRALVQRFGRQMKRMRADALIPVPVHKTRRRQRGFNQAEILARNIGQLTGIPVVCDLIIRNRKTIAQKKLGPRERLQNLEQAFEIKNLNPNIKSVILIDDIYTTGSTIEACTRVLKKAGITNVYYLSICIGKGV